MAVILASQSPRRRELLGRMGFRNFLIRPARGEEIFDPSLTPEQLVEALSRRKAEEVAAGSGPEDIVIAADTVVSVDGRVLGKPRDREDAAQMLAALSGREHMVYTGVTVRRGAQARHPLWPDSMLKDALCQSQAHFSAVSESIARPPWSV